MRRVCSSGWWRRWRGIVWCCVCIICLALLAIWDTLGYLLLASTDDHRTRHCPPSPVEVDGCASWRPLQVPHPTCACTRKLLVLHDTCTDFVATDSTSYMSYTREYYGNSHCSDQATLRGPRQHVVSLSMDYMTSFDLAALNQTIQKVNSAYKGWVVRVYTPADGHNHPGLCSVVCANPNLDLCDVKGMSKPPDTPTPQGRTGWRWAVLGDPLVSVWLVRYVEVEILEREAHAVTQFINSDKCWHLMKDHVSHERSPIGSGLLGGKTSWGTTKLRHVKHRLTNEIHSISDEETILEDALIPRMGQDVMTHDSVTCQKTLESVPYPSQRHPGQWVGMPSVNIWDEQQVPKSATHNEVPRKHQNITQQPLLLQKIAKKPAPATEKPKSNSVLPSQSLQGQQQELGHKDNPKIQVQKEEHKSNSEHNLQTSSLSHTTKATQREPKVPQRLKNSYPHFLDSTRERQINQENGIAICPQACRPHLHPDWQYC